MMVAPLVMGIDSERLWQVLVDGLVAGSSYATLGVAFALVFGVTRRFHFALGIVFTATAYVTAVLAGDAGVPLYLAAFTGLAAGACLAALIELAVYRPIADRAGDNALLGVFVAALGVSIVGENLLRLIWGSDARIIPGAPAQTFRIGSVSFDVLELGLVIIAAIVVAGLTLFLDRTVAGQRVKAARGNPEMAMAVGVNLNRVFLVVFALSAVIAGLVALIEAMRFSATADMGGSAVFYAFVVAFVAGVDRPPIVVAAVGMLTGLLARFSTLWLTENLSSLVVFGLLFVWLSARVTPRALRQLSGALARPSTSRAAIASGHGGGD